MPEQCDINIGENIHKGTESHSCLTDIYLNPLLYFRAKSNSMQCHFQDQSQDYNAQSVKTFHPTENKECSLAFHHA